MTRSMRLVLLLGLLLLWGGAGPTAARAQEVSIPSSSQLQQREIADHPRLFASEARFAELKEQIQDNEHVRSWYQGVQEKADGYLNSRLPRYVIADGLRLLSTSGRTLEHVRTLALVYRVEGEDRYARRAWEELEAVASFPDWNPKHFLDVAEMTHAVALGYDWLYDYWSPEQRATLEKALLRHGLNPAMAAYRGTLPDRLEGWTDYRKDWNWIHVTNGGIGLGALAVMEVYPELTGNVLHEALTHLVPAIKDYAPDGAWIEGPGYWNYATRYTTFILAGLQTAYGTDFGLSGLPGFSETGWFPLYMTSPIGQSFNFADSDADPARGAPLFWLASRYEEPAFARYQRQMAGPSVMNLVWFEPALAAQADAPLSPPRDRLFKGAEVATLRSAWNDPEALFAGLKAGDNKAPHSNLDLGTFVLDALGTRWATELGGDDYNLEGYFGRDSLRWTYYRMRTEGQNTLVLDPGPAGGQPVSAEADIDRFQSRSDRAFAIADLTSAYPETATRVRRGLALLNDRRQVLVQDEIRAEEPTAGWWFMHTRADIEVGSDGTTALLRRDGKRLWAKLLTPEAGSFEVKPARPLPSSPNPEGQARNEGVRKLALQLEEVTDERLAVLFVPLPEGSAPPEDLPPVQPLADW